MNKNNKLNRKKVSTPLSILFSLMLTPTYSCANNSEAINNMPGQEITVSQAELDSSYSKIGSYFDSYDQNLESLTVTPGFSSSSNDSAKTYLRQLYDLSKTNPDYDQVLEAAEKPRQWQLKTPPNRVNPELDFAAGHAAMNAGYPGIARALYQKAYGEITDDLKLTVADYVNERMDRSEIEKIQEDGIELRDRIAEAILAVDRILLEDYELEHPENKPDLIREINYFSNRLKD